jgi:dolichol kinase
MHLRASCHGDKEPQPAPVGEQQQQQQHTSSSSSSAGHLGALLHWAPAAAALAAIAGGSASQRAACATAALAASSAALFLFIMAHFPRSFTLGEGALAASLVALPALALPAAASPLPACLSATAQALLTGRSGSQAWPSPAAAAAAAAATSAAAAPSTLPVVVMLIYAVLAAAGSVWALRRRPAGAAPAARLLPLLAAGAAAAGLAGSAATILLLAAWTLLVFLPAAPALRAALLGAWALLLAASLPAMQLLSARGLLPRIVVRKGYHLLAIALFLPAFLADPEMLCLSLGVALSALVALEVARCARLPWLGPAVQAYMQRFVDGRDSGPVYVTHFTLLLGLAAPIWLAAALQEAGAGRLAVALCGMSGLVSIGVGDAAASVVGSTYGRVRPLRGSSKTLEGTAAGVACALLAWGLVLAPLGLLAEMSAWQLLALAGGTLWAGLLEAATCQLDNLVIPVFYLVHLLCMR